ncbi:hypothetical protein [Confluentibacter flavum]|uniref:Nuclear transport factor 2 family protein n=1 Tax=Confluentibacter flavum TaxID=1909700 RepID=A0A2N3HN75_9FLAO|nr:hypothetical protein [Confluentibacter flavum]PKQ46308.1 hypothetical protein CSW08_03865 [Confluentibacter flavum]
MKSSISLLLIIFFVFSLNAQEKEVKNPIDTTSVLTLDKTIKTLYNVISGESGKKRHWEQFKFLFKSDAKLIAAGKDVNGETKISYMKPDDYIKNSGKWLETNGFFEKEIHRTVNTFGNMAQVFSTYECFYNIKDKKPFMRGINSIQLWNDGKRWWIINLYWSQETRDNPIPEAYLIK